MPKITKENGLIVPKEHSKKDYHCISCNRDFVESSFYISYSIMARGNNGRMPICKKCIEDIYNLLVDKYDDCKLAQYRMCQLVDVYFDTIVYDGAEKQAVDSNTNICKIYMQKINSLPQYRNKTFADSPACEFDLHINKKDVNIDEDGFTDEDKKNKEDVLTLLGYDPFSSENEDDKKFLYNTLNGYLDEETLQDGFKISAIIEIVKSFNQLELINRNIAQLNQSKDISNSSQIKTLIETKSKLATQINNFAKANNISTNSSATKSKGANTLSGILKELRDKNIRESDVNLFDIRTCKAFRQVNDISNQSISQQLQFDENDYTDMINQQRAMLQSLQEKLDKEKEENRKLRVEIKDYENNRNA